MSNEEAIKVIRAEKKRVLRNWRENCDRNCCDRDLVMDAEEAMTAYDMAITALEKQEPAKPKLIYRPSKVAQKLLREDSTYICARCGQVCLKGYPAEWNETYCWHCGQKLDWYSENGYIKGKPEKSRNYAARWKGEEDRDDYTTSGGGRWWNAGIDDSDDITIVLDLYHDHIGS